MEKEQLKQIIIEYLNKLPIDTMNFGETVDGTEEISIPEKIDDAEFSEAEREVREQLNLPYDSYMLIRATGRADNQIYVNYSVLKLYKI